MPPPDAVEVEYAVPVDEVADKVVAGVGFSAAVVVSGTTSCAAACVG